MNELSSLIGDEVLFVPELKPVVLETYGSGELFGAGSHANHRPGDDNFGPPTALSNRENVAGNMNGTGIQAGVPDKVLQDYANSSKADYQIVLTGNVTLTKEIDFKNKNLYLCLNGYTLIFGQTETEGTGELATASVIKNVNNCIITTCNAAQTAAQQQNDGITGFGAGTGNRITGICYDDSDTEHYQKPYDRRKRVQGLDILKSTASSCIEAKGPYVGITPRSNAFPIKIDYIWSNYHNKIKYTSYDTDAAAFINAKGAQNVAIRNTTVDHLVGCQGGVLKAEGVRTANISNNTFTYNKAFKGACFNLKFDENNTGDLNITTNTFNRNGYAFYDYNDENPYTFGRYPYNVTDYWSFKSTNDIDSLVSMANQETSNATAPGYAANQMKPAGSYQYQNLGYEATSYDYETYVPNGIILIDNFGKPMGTANGNINFNNNTVTENMPYDLCSTVHISLSNILTQKISGTDYSSNVKLNVCDNDITKNTQYKSSLNEWDSAAGIVLSVNPNSHYRNLAVTT